MKQKFFTLIMMLALVIVAGKAFSAPGDKFSPYLNSTHTYTMTLAGNVGDSYLYTATASTEVLDPTDGGVATIVNAAAIIPAGGAASADVTWTGTGDFNLWISVTDNGGGSPTGCSNRRYITISVTNNFDVTIYALQIDAINGTPDAGWATATPVDAGCAAYYLPNYNIVGGNEGSSYVYFVVQKLTDNGVGTWAFSCGTDGTESYWNGSIWTTAPSGIALGTTKVLMRTLVSNVPAGQTVTQTVAATEGAVADGGAGNNSDSFAISSYPNLGAASFN